MKKRILLCFLILLFGLSGCGKSDESIIKAAYNDLKMPASLEEAIDLPTYIDMNPHYIEVVWTSSDENIIDLKGNIYRQTENQKVTLTAVLRFNEIEKIKEFEILVLGIDSNTVVLRTNSDANEIFRLYYPQKNADLPNIEEPTSEFATFLGWYLDPSFLEPFDVNSTLNSSTDIYAKWDVRQYEVEINYTGYIDKTEVEYIPFQGLLNIIQFINLDQFIIVKSISIADQDFQIGLINKHQRKFSIFVDTIEREYNIFYYEQGNEEIEFEKYFLNYADNETLNYYGISSDNKFYSIIVGGTNTIYYDLGTLALANDDEIVEVFQSGNQVYAISQKDNIFKLYNEYNTGGYNDITPQQYGGYEEKLGSYVKLAQSFNSQEVTAIYSNGIIGLTRLTDYPFIYILEDKDDSIIDAVEVYNDYYILTSQNRLHYVSKWFSKEKDVYWDITDSLGLLDEEKIIQVFALNRDNLYLLTSNNRIIQFRNYSQDSSNPTNPNTSFDLNLELGEKAESISNGYLKSDKNNYYLIDLIAGTKKLDLPLNEDEYIINQFPKTNDYNYRIPMFVTNTRNIIMRNEDTREFERIENLILDEDEEVLSCYFYPTENYDKYLITTKQAYMINGTKVDYEIFDEIISIIGRNDIIYILHFGEYFLIITKDGIQHTYYNYEYSIKSTPEIWNKSNTLTLKYNDDIPLDYDEIPFVERGWSTQIGILVPPKNTKVTADLNLFLFHDVNTYELKFITNSSLEIDSIIVKRNEDYNIPTPVLDSKFFVGWYRDEDFKTKFDYNLDFGKSYTIYARWSNPTYFIYYHDSDGIEPTEIKAGFSPEITYQIPQKEGHEFSGWEDAEGNQFWSSYEPNYDDIHLYPRFERAFIQIGLIDINNNNYYYHIYGRYEDSLGDLVDEVYGMKINEFFSDNSFSTKLDLNTLVYTTMTLYVNIEPIMVPIILLEEILSAPNAKFSLVNNNLLVENDNNIYYYKYNKKELLDDNSEYYYLDPLNLTNIIGISKIEDVLYTKEIKDFLIFIADNNLYYISKETKILEKTINIPLQENEELIIEQIMSISTWNWENPNYAFIFATTKGRTITIDSFDKINNYIGYTNMVLSPSEYIVLELKDRLWVICIDSNNNNLIFKEVDGSYLENRNQQVFGITFIDDWYFEVYKDGSFRPYSFIGNSGLHIDYFREDNLELQAGEDLKNIFGRYAYTSNDRMIDISDPNHFISYTLLSNEEFAYAVFSEPHQMLFVTNQNRVFLDYKDGAIITLQQGERVLYYFEDKVITNYGLYYLDFEQEKWSFRNDFLAENETIIDLNQEFIITSSNRAIYIAGAIEHSFKLVTFNQYKPSEIIYKLYGSSPELPKYGDDFEGWYYGEYFIREFETVMYANYVILYPKWK